MKDILDAYAAGAINEHEAKEKLLRFFYDRGEEFLLDMHRSERLGFPEIIFAESKTVEQVLRITDAILAKDGRVCVSNLLPEQEKALRERFGDRELLTAGRFMTIGPKVSGLGTVGIITAGTSDIPYAKECALVLEFMGVLVLTSYDAGVAGIHRPYFSLEDVHGAEVLIILAGMEGALPTLIASITDRPIIAVPTPIGYGIGGQGIGAMTSMLQSCAPGVLVVNIGNTIGAAAGAIRILRALRRTP